MCGTLSLSGHWRSSPERRNAAPFHSRYRGPLRCLPRCCRTASADPGKYPEKACAALRPRLPSAIQACPIRADSPASRLDQALRHGKRCAPPRDCWSRLWTRLVRHVPVLWTRSAGCPCRSQRLRYQAYRANESEGVTGNLWWKGWCQPHEDRFPLPCAKHGQMP